MAFWTEGQLQDPKRQYRFLVSLGGYDGSAQWYAKQVSKPSLTISDTKHVYLNHSFYYPGRAEWSEISVTLVDPVSPDAAAETAAIIQASGYVIPVDRRGVTTMSKVKAVGALKNVIIRQIDSNGEALETWTLQNPFLKSVNFGDLNYEGDALTNVTIGIRYDWATLETATPASENADFDNGTFGVVGPLDNKFWSTEA